MTSAMKEMDHSLSSGNFDSCSRLSRTSEKRNKRVPKLVQFFAFALPSFCLLFAFALPWLCPRFAFALPSLCFVLPYNSVSKRIPPNSVSERIPPNSVRSSWLCYEIYFPEATQTQRKRPDHCSLLLNGSFKGWRSATQQKTLRNIIRPLRSLVSLLSVWKDP